MVSKEKIKLGCETSLSLQKFLSIWLEFWKTRIDDINRPLAALNVCEAVLIPFQILSLGDIAPIFQPNWYVFVGYLRLGKVLNFFLVYGDTVLQCIKNLQKNVLSQVNNLLLKK